MKKLALLLVVAALILTSAVAVFAADPYEVIFVPKLIGIPWFTTMEKGFVEYGDGALNVTTMGATDADPAAQARMLEDAIAKAPDAIVVVPNDTATLEPLLRKGREAGILMITQEAPTVKNADVDIEFLILEQEGKDVIELLAKNMGEEGGYAIMVGGLTVEGHNNRADAMVKYQEEKYPKMFQVTSRVEGGENVQVAHDKVLELTTAYPEMKGIVTIGSLGGIGASQAVREKNLIGKFSVIGCTTPSESKAYLEDKSMAANYIGNPYRIGLDSAFIVQQLLDGKKLEELTELPEYGEPSIDGTTITFHADSEVTFENADSFGF